MAPQRIYLFVVLFGTLITMNVAFPKQADRTKKPSGTKDIFQHPNNSTISQIKGTSTPWIIPELIPAIEEFRKNVFEDFKNSTVQSVWDLRFESSESRSIFFTFLNKYLYTINHPVPTALANSVSKAASLFDPLTMPVFFESDAIHLAEFLLSRDIKITRDTAASYVKFVSDNLDLAQDLTKLDSFFWGYLCGYSQFIESFGFKLVEVADELFELYSSQLIVMHDK